MRYILLIGLLILALPVHADVTDGLVGWWKFDETSGATAHDSSGQVNDGSLVNSPTWVAGKRGNGLLFNGTSQHVAVGSLTPPASITVSFWNFVNTADVKNSGAFCYGGGTSINRVLIHAPWSDKVLYWDYGNANNGGGRVFIDYTNYLDQWTLITGIYDGATGLHALYLNGVLVVSNSSFNSTSGLSGLEIGRFTDSGVSDFHKGAIDDFRLYNRALSATEVLAIYQSASPKMVVKGGAKLRNFRMR